MFFVFLLRVDRAQLDLPPGSTVSAMLGCLCVLLDPLQLLLDPSGGSGRTAVKGSTTFFVSCASGIGPWTSARVDTRWPITTDTRVGSVRFKLRRVLCDRSFHYEFLYMVLMKNLLT